MLLPPIKTRCVPSYHSSPGSLLNLEPWKLLVVGWSIYVRTLAFPFTLKCIRSTWSYKEIPLMLFAQPIFLPEYILLVVGLRHFSPQLIDLSMLLPHCSICLMICSISILKHFINKVESIYNTFSVLNASPDNFLPEPQPNLLSASLLLLQVMCLNLLEI